MKQSDSFNWLFGADWQRIQAKGMEAYDKSWEQYFSWAQDSEVFDITEMNITAGSEVAFVTALTRCAGVKANGERIELDFRLTICLRKLGSNGSSRTNIIRSPRAKWTFFEVNIFYGRREQL